MEELESKRGWLVSVIQYLAWIVAVVGSILDTLAIREAILSLLAWYQVVSYQAYRQAGNIGQDLATGFALTAVDMFTLFILALVAITITISIDYYFRRGRAKGLLYKRIGKVFGIEAAILVVALLLRVIVSAILKTLA